MSNPNHFNLFVHGFPVLLIMPVAFLSILTTSVLYRVLLTDGVFLRQNNALFLKIVPKKGFHLSCP